MLSGYKTYVAAVGLVIVAALFWVEKITFDQAMALTIALNGGGLAALRAGVKNG